MAGIGFELNRLSKRDDLSGIAAAFLHSAFATSGPWLLTVIALALITLFYGMDSLGNADYTLSLLNFRGIIVYNFSISLVISAPVFLVMTRYLADHIHVKNVTAAPAAMFESLLITYMLQLPIALFFYAYYFEMPTGMLLAGFANMFLVVSVWLLGVFLTALKDYIAVTWAFFSGLLVAVISSYFLSAHYDTLGMLIGFNIGLMLTVFWLIARILSEYPYVIGTELALKPYFRRYWELAIAGFFYNAAIWIDKWIMWFAPEAIILPSNLRFYPDYDNAMFLAYLCLVPAFALFVVNVETQFFHHYRRFYRNVLEHASMRQIRKLATAINDSVLEGSRNLILVQGATCLIAIVLAPQIFELLENVYIQLGIFRIGTLGVFFHGLMLFTTIILQYFDCRRELLWIYAYFFVSNAILTLWIMLFHGFEFYGFGYFLSAVTTFAISVLVLFGHIRQLPYHAFITNNNSIRSKKVSVAAVEEHSKVW
jgi:uncharacterized membrane protein